MKNAKKIFTIPRKVNQKLQKSHKILNIHQRDTLKFNYVILNPLAYEILVIVKFENLAIVDQE